MRFELGLEEPQAGRALRSAVTIAGSYILGGLVPLLPYMLGTTRTALPASVGITLLALLLFGAVKGRVTGAGAVRSGLQTVDHRWRRRGCRLRPRPPAQRPLISPIAFRICCLAHGNRNTRLLFGGYQIFESFKHPLRIHREAA